MARHNGGDAARNRESGLSAPVRFLAEDLWRGAPGGVEIGAAMGDRSGGYDDAGSGHLYRISPGGWRQAREANLAVFHAAQAYIFERTGKLTKTHRGVRSEFTRLSRTEPRIGRDLVTFLGTAYQFKTRSDYAIASTATPITDAEATAAIDSAARLIDTIAQLLPSC